MAQRILVCDEDYLIVEDLVELLTAESAADVEGFTSFGAFREAMDPQGDDLEAVFLNYLPSDPDNQSGLDQLIDTDTVIVLMDGAAAETLQLSRPDILVLHKPFVQDTVSSIVRTIGARSSSGRPAPLPDPL